MKRLLILLICTICFPVLLSAQETFSISGTVKDNKGEPLPGAAIYLSGYKMASVSNSDGYFILGKMPAGKYDVLVQLIGFTPTSKSILVSNKAVQVDLVLHESNTQLKEVVINPSKRNYRHFNLFRDNFLGITPNASECKILNPEVIFTDYDDANQRLNVSATDLIIIENKALGYRIKYLLEHFIWDAKERILSYSGHPYFEEIKGSDTKQRTWEKNRDLAYYGSPQHFLTSLYNNTLKEEGYILQKISRIPNPSRLPDALIDLRLNYWLSQKTNRMFSGGGSQLLDSLNFWKDEKNKPEFVSLIDTAKIRIDTLVTVQYSNVKTMNFKDELHIQYTKERESYYYVTKSGYYIVRPHSAPNYQVSTMKVLEGPVHFYPNGSLFNPLSVFYAGFWAYEKVADMVPTDYIPRSQKELSP